MSSQLPHGHLSEYPEWHNSPLLLTKQEMDQPHLVFAEFFDWYHLQDIRACLKEWLRESLRSTEVLKRDYLTIHDHLLKLTEAAWVLHQAKSKVKSKKSPPPSPLRGDTPAGDSYVCRNHET